MSAAVSTTKPVLGSFTADRFAAHLARQPAVAPAWWLERKRAAFTRFAELPMPSRIDEGWRFSRRETLTLDGFDPEMRAGQVPVPADALSLQASLATLTFINGTLASRTHLPTDLSARGVIAGTLAEGLLHHPELLRTHFMAQPQKLGSEKFAALHTAFVSDGAFIYIPKGVELSSPIVVTHAMSGTDLSIFPHTLVIAEENSKATVIDLFVTLGATNLTSNATDAATAAGFRRLAIGANDLYAGHGSQLTYAAAQVWSRDTLSFQLNSTVVRRDAQVKSLNLHLGGQQSRHESLSQLQAPGALSEMLALTVASDDQEFDQRTLQIHQAPNTKSDLLYKNALMDQSRTIFSGLIVVDPDAQKTDAYQSNRNLMLSDEAEANSLPGLEIQANDVRCTHGATSGRIEPEQLFYLKSRGIDPAKAHELLVFGFFEEVLTRLDNEPLHLALVELLKTKFKA